MNLRDFSKATVTHEYFSDNDIKSFEEYDG